MNQKISNMKSPLQIFILCTILLATACYKDKGNYDIIEYSKINNITHPSVPPVIQGDTLKLKPAFTWEHPEKDTTGNAFEFEWRQLDSVVSHERNLAYVPDITGYIMIYLHVKEKATGIVTRFVIQVQVISSYKAGWLLLSNDQGKSVISFVRRDAKRDNNNQLYYEYKYFPDIYNQLHPDAPLGNNPLKFASKAFPDYTADEVMLFQGNATTYLSGSDLSKVIDLRNEFNGNVFPNNAVPVDYVDGGPVNFTLLSDGNIYWKRNSVTMGGIHQGKFMSVPVYFEGGGAHISRIIDVSIDYTYFLYLYDDLHKRFLGLFTTTGDDSFLGGKLYVANGSTPPAGFVDLNNQSGYALIYCSDYANGAYFMNIIKNETSGQYLLQNYRLTRIGTVLEANEHQQEVFAGNGIVTDNTVYHRIRNSSYLFFGEGSKLYFYDVNTKQVKLYHDFGSGTIKAITTDAPGGELGVALDNGVFAICSLKTEILGSANPGATGILFSQQQVGDIVDLSWKWGSYYEYVFRRYP